MILNVTVDCNILTVWLSDWQTPMSGSRDAITSKKNSIETETRILLKGDSDNKEILSSLECKNC